MAIHVKDGGVWKEASLYVRDGGVWKAVNEGYIKDAGTWKQFFVNRVAASITIASNTSNYVLNTSKVTGYVAGKTDVTLTINSGVFVYSASTGSYALTVDTSWTTGDTITIVNNGVIQGRGGDGASQGGTGSSGGPALNVQRATSINNGNRIAGGGGGGGGGGVCYLNYKFGTVLEGAGGGGGGGLGISTGGAASYDFQGRVATAGGNGTLTSAGGGGSRSMVYGGDGGSGGSYASSGGNGTRGIAAESSPGGPGGAGGAAVVGNSNITWIATGTRNGSIS